MASIDRTSFANVIPTVWEPLLEYAAQQPRGVADRVWNVSDRVQGPGNSYKINILPALAVTAGFASGNLQSWTVGGSANYIGSQSPTTRTMTLSLKQGGITLEEDIQQFSVADLAEAWTPVLAEMIYQGIDIDLLNLYTNFSSTGTSASNFTEADFLTALSALNAAAGDKMMPGDTDIYGVYDLGQFDNILGFGNIISASVRGDKGPSSAVTGRINMTYGVQIMLTGNVVSSSGRRNLLFGRKAMAYGKKSNAKIETDRRDLITYILAHCTWGVVNVHNTLGYQHITA